MQHPHAVDFLLSAACGCDTFYGAPWGFGMRPAGAVLWIVTGGSLPPQPIAVAKPASNAIRRMRRSKAFRVSIRSHPWGPFYRPEQCTQAGKLGHHCVRQAIGDVEEAHLALIV